jgi:hypothetical protein
MEENTPSSPLATLRPHHALCALFFEGKGYSQTFVDNMTTFLADSSQMLQITAGCDTLCMACPNNFNGLCSDAAKVSLFDQRTVNLTGARSRLNRPCPYTSSARLFTITSCSKDCCRRFAANVNGQSSARANGKSAI